MIIDKNIYFRDVFYKDSKITKRYRKCPICLDGLLSLEYLGNEKYWENEDIAIPCCTCYTVIKRLRKCMNYFVVKRFNEEEIYGLKTYHSTKEGNYRKCFYLDEDIVNRLFLLGFIEKEKVINHKTWNSMKKKLDLEMKSMKWED